MYSVRFIDNFAGYEIWISVLKVIFSNNVFQVHRAATNSKT